MGIASSCFLSTPPPIVKLVFWGGAVELLPETQLAGEIMFKHPNRIICQADSFYIGHPIPVLSIDDKLVAGQTYFVLPVDCLPDSNLTTAALACLSSSKQKPALAGLGSTFPFEYVKGSDGRMLIKVQPEFIVKVISAANESHEEKYESGGGEICTTPELRKHYAQLVGSRERPWSPKLETITEKKPRSSPVRLLGFEKS